MNITFPTRALAAALCGAILLAPGLARADDIDIFTGASAGSNINPRILIVLDNTTNWSRASQKWPDEPTQGQAEVRALQNVIAKLSENVNVGLMMFDRSSVAGGYIRQAVAPMTPENKASLHAKLDTIYNNINTSGEKASTDASYGYLMSDVYSYFAGGIPSAPADVPAKADANGYTDALAKFRAPIDSSATCGRSFVIFIGNNGADKPKADVPANLQKLAGLGGVTSALGLPDFKSEVILVPQSIGTTSACYATQAEAAAALPSFSTACTAFSKGCIIGAPVATDTTCAANTFKYHVLGVNEEITNEATGDTSTDTYNLYGDEWARFMHDKGVPVANSEVRPYVTTFTIDVYNKQSNAPQTALLLSMSKVGGGKYFAAQSKQAIENALDEILGEVLAVNGSFASTSLPVNATNRSQNENQVFIGMFRPDPNKSPRWFGNLKRYQLISRGDTIELGDVDGKLAVNTLTGFLTPCATSYWTNDNGPYWDGVQISPKPNGTCTEKPIDSDVSPNPLSDAPDGPLVEKGAVAQVLRNGNNPPVTTAAPTYAVNRNIYTLGATGMTAFTAASSNLPEEVVRFTRGEDVNNERNKNMLTSARPSIHGDVIHSRPLPINYGGDTGVVVYYGANDGTFRAVHAATGKENWAFIAPEFFSRLNRLKVQSPLLNYPRRDGPSLSATEMPKDYFFDGSTGVFQNTDSTKVWVYPTMRRGGRMIYALDVSSPTAPVFKWKAGCPNLTDDLNCTSGMSGIGQTWSTPAVAFLKGYSKEDPVVLVGGGYDRCEDANSSAPSCGSTKGGFVYILNAFTGELLSTFQTERGVAADISLIDIDNDAMPDYAYAADIGGNIYRINFINNPSERKEQARENWSIHKVAFTDGDGRKFLFGPALLAVKNKSKDYINNVYLAIGSGDREHPLSWQYPFTGVRNRFYVRLDDLEVSDSTKAQDLDAMSDFSAETSCTSPAVLPGGELKGWYMNLAQGEQVVTSALIASGMATFSTNRPMAASETSCAAALGEAKGYWVNLFNASGGVGVDGTCGGQRSSIFIGGGLPPSPVMASGVPVKGRAVSVVIGAVQKSGGASVAISPQKIRPAINSRRKRAYTYTK